MKEFDFDEKPYVDDFLVAYLKYVFPESILSCKTMEDLYFARGVQTIVNHLELLNKNNNEEGS